MENATLNRLNIFRGVSYFYLFLICVLWFLDNRSAGYYNWFIFILGTLLALQVIFRIPGIDKIFGFVLCLLSIYMLLAVTSDLADHFNGTKPVRSFAKFFVFGYGTFTLALLSGIIIVYTNFAKERLKRSRSQVQAVHG